MEAGQPDRRTVLALLGAGVAGIAGCNTVQDEDDESETDHTENELLAAGDLDPHQFSLTEDPYSAGFVTDLLGFDPEKPTVGWFVEFTEAADESLARWALEETGKEYERNGIQTFYIIGRQDVGSVDGSGDLSGLADAVVGRALEADLLFETAIENFPLHYILFGEAVHGESATIWGLWSDRARRKYSYINTDPRVTVDGYRRRDAIRWTTIAESFENLYSYSSRSDEMERYRRKRTPAARRKSWTNWYNGNLPEYKEILPDEREMMETDDWGFRPDRAMGHITALTGTNSGFDPDEGYLILDSAELAVF